MNAILWKKYIDLRNSRMKILLFFVAPIVYYVALIMNGIQYNTIFGFFSLAFTVFSSSIHWDVEDMVYSESLVSTTVNAKTSWKLNFVVVSLVGNLYSWIILFFGSIILEIVDPSYMTFHIVDVLQLICNVFVSMAIVAYGTIFYLDFTKAKQMYSGIFSIQNIVIPIVLFIYGNHVNLSVTILVIEVALCAVLFVIAAIIAKYSTSEKLVINLQKLVEGYTNNLIND